jgi:hypothetical protein
MAIRMMNHAAVAWFAGVYKNPGDASNELSNGKEDT